MSDTTLTIRTDNATKQAIADFAASLGLSTSAFMTAATLQAIREGQLTLTPVLEPTPYLERIMREVDEDIKHDRNITHTNSKEEATSHIKSLM
jgi:antitoxin component of RelBE/YafQ-DinJ toxin-antitoxin module